MISDKWKELKKGSELENVCLLAWYSPVRWFFFLPLYWGHKPTLIDFLSGFPRCKSVNVSLCHWANMFLQNFTVHRHSKLVHLVNWFHFDIQQQNMAAFPKWSAIFHTELVVMNWSFYSSKFLISVVNEYKFTIFTITKTRWIFTILSGNRHSFIGQKKNPVLSRLYHVSWKLRTNSLSCIRASLSLKCLIYIRYLSEMHSQKLNDEQCLWHSAQDFFPHYLYLKIKEKKLM